MGAHTINNIMKYVMSKSPLKTWKHITNHSARKTLVKRLKQNNIAKSEIISITGISGEAGLDPYDSGDEKQAISNATEAAGYIQCNWNSRLYSMQLIIVASTLFRIDSASFQQMIHEFWIQHFRFSSRKMFNKIYFPYMTQLICTTAVLNCIKIHHSWVQLQSKKTMNLSRNAGE